MLIYLQLLKESFNFAIKSLRDNKLRTFLSLLGVTVGIFSIISVLAAVDSLNPSIHKSSYKVSRGKGIVVRPAAQSFTIFFEHPDNS